MAPITLYELNRMVKELIADSFTDSYWITAELSEVRAATRGHCYLELVEQGEHSAAPIAKARAVIYSNLFPLLKQTFEEALAWQKDHYDTSFYDSLEKTDYRITSYDGYVIPVQFLNFSD